MIGPVPFRPSRVIARCRLLALLVIVAPLVLTGCQSDTTRTVPLGMHALSIGEHEVLVEIAADPQTRRTGLMYRDHLAEDRGMLFIFTQPQMQSFYMRNCLIDLDIAYLDDEGKIVDLLRMTAPPADAQTFPRYKSTKPVRYALETNAGWFEKRGIGVGATVDGYRGPANARPR